MGLSNPQKRYSEIYELVEKEAKKGRMRQIIFRPSKSKRSRERQNRSKQNQLQGDKAEQRIYKITGIPRQPGSGRGNRKGDHENDTWIIEDKSTNRLSYRVSAEIIKKIARHARKAEKYWALVVALLGPDQPEARFYCIMPIREACQKCGVPEPEKERVLRITATTGERVVKFGRRTLLIRPMRLWKECLTCKRT